MMNMKMGARSLLAIGPALFAISAMAHADKDTALSEADHQIARCLAYAASDKLRPLSVGVLDASGTLLAFKRQDGAAPATADAALLKARTALRLNAPTSALAEVAGDAPTRDAFLIMQLTIIPGGVPLVDEGGKLTGAVGVSGSAPDQDAECARRAIEARPAKK